MTLGSDISGVEDLDAALSEVSGRLALAQAILRRFKTPVGTLPEDPTYGFALVEIIGTTVSTLRIEQGVLAQVYAEEEVDQASASVTYSLGSEAVAIEIRVRDGEGPFELTVTADALTIEMLLNGQPVAT